MSQKDILHQVERTIADQQLIKKGERIAIALSGGPDSVCLFYLLLALRQKLDLTLLACHFNHRLRGEASDQDEAFVQKICQKNGVELILGWAGVRNLYKNEESARDARYAFFEKILREGRADRVATAHQQNDVAETVLFRLIRGTGLLGLGAIPFSRDKIIRPLLKISRSEILAFLDTNKLDFRLDQTNHSPTHQRNKIRLELLPVLMDYNPNIVETLAEAASSFASDYDYLHEQAMLAYDKLILSEDSCEIILSRKDWLLLHPALQSLVLRLAIGKISSLIDITNTHLEEVKLLISRNIGNKHKILPSSLRIELQTGKIIIRKQK
jgi:tRNA(Ile)-lysidine synthase